MSTGAKVQGAHILIIDDDAILQQQLKSYLSRRNYKLTIADSQASGRKALETDNIDLVLMDIVLPDGNSLYYCEDLKAIKDVPIIIITGQHTSPSDEIAGLTTAFADDYIRKPLDQGVLLARIEVALRNNREKVSNNEVTSGRYVLDINRSTLYVDALSYNLTPSECRILHILMENADSIIEYSPLLDYVYGNDSFIMNDAVQQTISRIYKKLGGKSNTPIECIRGVGYKWNSSKAQ